MLNFFFYNIFILITCNIAALLLGRMLTDIFRFNCTTILSAFINWFVGTMALITGYALIMSGGKTIMSVFTFSGLIFLFIKRNEIKPIRFYAKKITHEILYMLGFSVLAYLFFIFQVIDFQNNAFKPVYNDFFLYATFIDSLKLWGSEHIFTSVSYFFNDFRNGVMPYHFPELWLTAFVSDIFNCPSVTTYVLITSSVTSGLFAMAIASVFEPIVKNKILLFSIAISLTYLSGFFIPLFNSIAGTDIEWYSWVSISGYSGIKFAFSYIFIILSFIVFSKSDCLGGLVLF